MLRRPQVISIDSLISLYTLANGAQALVITVADAPAPVCCSHRRSAVRSSRLTFQQCCSLAV